MTFDLILTEQLKNHPNFLPQDIVKLCYQSAFGGEHLKTDLKSIYNRLVDEYNKAEIADIPLFEDIGNGLCRANISAFKYHNLPCEWLYNAFICTEFDNQFGLIRFEENINTAIKVLGQFDLPFTQEDFIAFVNDYKKKGVLPLHHSQLYRDFENPSYRVLSSLIKTLEPILLEIANVKNFDKPFVIAIDGRAGAGKTTYANFLSKILNADVVKMDHFFLPLDLRTADRFNIPGSNVHYERFLKEVIPFINKPTPFSYEKFDCSIMELNGNEEISSTKFRIVEGSYSLHPIFPSYYDLSVFVDVDEKEQLSRIKLRNGIKMAKVFKEKWIPLEDKYFNAYDIEKKADVLI